MFPVTKETNHPTGFLYELYEKELELRNKFSNHEIEDIREAIFKQVHLIANAIQEIDKRHKVQEVLLVGSARERTQIIRPCEYDFVLILEALSKPGAVSMIPEDTEGDSREYMHIKLKDDCVRSMFREVCDKDCIRATHRLPWNCQGLRDLFTSAVLQAVMLCSRSSIKMDTGTLKLKRPSPKMNGPASTIHLLWERTTTGPHTTMEISTDLCSTKKLDFKEYYSLLPTFDKVVTNDSNNIESVESEFLSSDHAVPRDFAKRIDKLLSPYDSVTSINVNHDTVSELVMPSPDNLASDLFRYANRIELPCDSVISRDSDHSKRDGSVLQPSDNDYTNEPENAQDTKSVFEPSEEPRNSAIMNDFDYAKSTEPILSSTLKLVSVV